MSIYEAVGIAWIIFTSSLATVGILYLAFARLRILLNRQEEDAKDAMPVEVKEMFKVAR